MVSPNAWLWRGTRRARWEECSNIAWDGAILSLQCEGLAKRPRFVKTGGVSNAACGTRRRFSAQRGRFVGFFDGSLRRFRRFDSTPRRRGRLIAPALPHPRCPWSVRQQSILNARSTAMTSTPSARWNAAFLAPRTRIVRPPAIRLRNPRRMMVGAMRRRRHSLLPSSAGGSQAPQLFNSPQRKTVATFDLNWCTIPQFSDFPTIQLLLPP